jgi:hypothetical protein
MNDQLQLDEAPKSDTADGASAPARPSRISTRVIVLAVVAALLVVASPFIAAVVIAAPWDNESTEVLAEPESEVPSIEEIVERQRAYLATETAATPEQIDCAADALSVMDPSEAQALELDGIGAAVYVPCGLPD